jgi:hypothetical protein
MTIHPYIFHITGYAGGSHYTHTGAAANYQCLPNDPTWSKYNDAVGDAATMYGAEFEVGGSVGDTLFGGHLADQDVACVVCRSRSRATSVMIPARTSCYVGWHLEYAGYLMAGASTHVAASEFVCVDAHPQPEPHSFQNDNGKLFYFVEGICGSLPCPPYVNGRELACVVCTK